MAVEDSSIPRLDLSTYNSRDYAAGGERAVAYINEILLSLDVNIGAGVHNLFSDNVLSTMVTFFDATTTDYPPNSAFAKFVQLVTSEMALVASIDRVAQGKSEESVDSRRELRGRLQQATARLGKLIFDDRVDHYTNRVLEIVSSRRVAAQSGRRFVPAKRRFIEFKKLASEVKQNFPITSANR